MSIAERLYTAGLISYPRTESSAYSKSFDFRAILRDHKSHPVWGEYAGALLASSISEPKVSLKSLTQRIAVAQFYSLSCRCSVFASNELFL